MPKQRLTDRQLISGVTLTDLLHFVVTGDTSQNPAGSSYKGNVEQLFGAFSAYTCSNPLTLDVVNACTTGITINGNVIINGSATTINTEVIQSKDNNIVLNYSGTHLTAIGGGITLEDGQSNGVDSRIYTDSNGTWLFDPGLSASTGTINDFTANTISVTTIGNSGDCVNDLYVSNIHSCSPLNINPLDEGNIYFGSTSGITIDVANSRLGIGESNPDRRLVVSGSKATLYVDTDEQDPLATTFPGNRIFFEGNPSGATRIVFGTEANVGVSIGQLGSLADSGNLILGNPLDTFIYSNSQANNLNIITQSGSGTDDNIRFYAGSSTSVSTGTLLSGITSAMHIQGNGGTIGYVGINNDSPTERLDVSGNTKISGSLNIGTILSGTPLINLGLDSSGNVVTGVTTIDTNFANTDLTFDGNRTHNTDGNNLTIKTNTNLANSTYILMNSSNSATTIGSTTSFLTMGGPSQDKLYLEVDGLSVMRISNTYIDLNQDGEDIDISLGSVNNPDMLFVDASTDRVGIGTNLPSETLDVSGNTKISGSLNIGTILSGTPLINLGLDSSGNVVTGTTAGGAGTIVTGFTYSNNNFTISQDGGQPDLVANISTMTGLTINGDLEVYGQSTMSGSGQNILTIIGSGDTNPLFTVQGSSGELFSITDSLVGSLFSVNDISGLPILEVFDNDTIHMGNYQAPSLNTTVLLNPSTGLSTVYSIPMSAYTGAWFEYTVSNTGGARAGQIMSIFSGNTVNFTETTTTDIGSTSDVTFSMSADSTNTLLQVSATTTGWEVKTIVRSI